MADNSQQEQEQQPVAEEPPPPHPAAAPAAAAAAPLQHQPSKMESQQEKPAPAFVNIVTGILSIFSFILSLALLAYAVWLFYMRDYDCEDLLSLPHLQTWTSVGLILMFVISNAAIFLRTKFPMTALVMVVIPFILMLFMGLAYVGVNAMESRRITGTPMWFKLKIIDQTNWNNIKSCIYRKGVCHDMAFMSFNAKSYDFSMNKISSIECGCCKPPSICGMEFVNATYWKSKVDAESSGNQDQDCDLWKNDESILCYDCMACKEGFMRVLRRKWWRLGVFFVVMSILLVITHLLLFLGTIWERYKG